MYPSLNNRRAYPLRHIERIWLTAAPGRLRPFEKEVVLFLFSTWTFLPGGPRISAAKQLAEAITLHRRDENGRPIAGRITMLSELQERLNEKWYKEFYELFYLPMIGGFGFMTGLSTFGVNKTIDNRKDEL